MILFKEIGYFNGDIHEILVYDNNQTQKEMRSNQCYLSQKYSISLSSVDCSSLTPVQDIYNVSTATSTITVGAENGVPPYSFSVASGSGTIDSATGVFTIPASAGSSSITITDLLGSSATTTIHYYDEFPSDISGLIAWWDASSLSNFLDNSSIGKWGDSSGNGETAFAYNTQTAIYRANSINGFPAVRGATSKLVAAGLGANWATSDGSVFIAVNLNNDTQYGFFDISATADFWRLASTGNAYQGTFRDTRINNTGAMPTSGNYIFSITSGVTDYYQYNNGTQLINTSSSWGVKDDLDIFNSGSDYFDGDIAELIFYDDELSPVQRQSIECYLAQKYNIADAITASCP